MALSPIFVRSDMAKPSVFEEKYNTINTTKSVIGKPKENRFSVGAERVIIPMATFTKRRTVITGNIIIDAAKNIEPAEFIPAFKMISKLGKNSMGIVL